MTRGLRALADLLLPRECIVCGRKLLLDERHLCLYCLADMPLTRYWTMDHNPMADRFNAAIQNRLEIIPGMPREKYAYAAALFFYDSDSGYRHIPHQIKYHGNITAGRHFGKMLGRKLAEAQWTGDVDIVIPVPLHWRRKWSRGYNQAEIIAAEVARQIGAPLRTDILKRRRNTKTQTKLAPSAKATNVKDAFECTHAGCGEVRHILLVDDVFTTGATLHACFQALRRSFPPSVRISATTLGFVGD